MKLAALALVLALGFSARAAAHTTSTGLATVAIDGRSVTWRLTLALAELPEEPARLIARAADGDQASAARVAEALREQVRVTVDGEACRPGRIQVQGSRDGGARAVLQVAFSCARTPGKLELTDALSGFFGGHYRTIASVTGPDGARVERIFEEATPRATFDFERPAVDGWRNFLALAIAAAVAAGALWLIARMP